MNPLFLRKQPLYVLGIMILLTSCISEDIVNDRVDEMLNITTPLETLEVGTTFQLEAAYLNEVGIKEETEVVWVSSDTDIITVSPTGLAEAIAPGMVDITVSLPNRFDLSDVIMVTAGAMTSVEMTNARTGAIRTTSSYILEGDFTLAETETGLQLTLADNFRASSTLPGLYVYLTNNPNTNVGALEISLITKFNGTSTYDIPGNPGINDHRYVLFYCKPFSVKVGDGEFAN